MRYDTPLNLSFIHRVRFTRDLLAPENPALIDVLKNAQSPSRVLAFVDTQVAKAFPDLPTRLRRYATAHEQTINLVQRIEPVVGGELCKNDRDAIYRVLNAIDVNKLDRQSYILAIGGGAVLDCVGFAAAIAHRGMRLIRVPTTTLAQADSGVGVKNGINGFGKKNYLGSFAVPWAVINDNQFLTTLSETDWVSGFSEAVKVALLKDRRLFERIERDALTIRSRDMAASSPVIQKSAELHLQHIAAGGDPFELTSARPLDFGHWAGHKLEQMSDFRMTHGHAVAIGLAIDTLYAQQVGLLAPAITSRVLRSLIQLGFTLQCEQLAQGDELLTGLDEFREHLGGELTITLLRDIGEPIDVHEIHRPEMLAAISQLREIAPSLAAPSAP